jgi:hypothetical protein
MQLTATDLSWPCYRFPHCSGLGGSRFQGLLFIDAMGQTRGEERGFQRDARTLEHSNLSFQVAVLMRKGKAIGQR